MTTLPPPDGPGNPDKEAGSGWESTFGQFGDAPASRIVESLRGFVGSLAVNPGVSDTQRRAWDSSVRGMQRELREVEEVRVGSRSYGVILEYQLPLEFRRMDGVLLLNRSGSVVVVEFKGDKAPTEAGVDQVRAYARDLRAYHRECDGRPVHPVLVPMRMEGSRTTDRDVTICGPGGLDDLILELDREDDHVPPLDRKRFLRDDAYRPLPSLVTAARELFQSRRVRRLWRSILDTDLATKALLSVVREARETGTRRLALLTGVPGAGKTLAGLRVVHEPNLGGTEDPNTPMSALFLSGNDPLVKVLQHELRAAGGDGKVFVRPVKPYVDTHAKRPGKIPAEHVVVFDEAQRAWDLDRIRAGHSGQVDHKTEPGHLVEFAGRRPDWAVIIGLIGSGQEIQVGEEGGLALWRDALAECGHPGSWTVHGPPGIRDEFAGIESGFVPDKRLRLAHSVRSHLSNVLHEYVDALLGFEDRARLLDLSRQITASGFDFKVSRDLGKCEDYLRERYGEHPAARYGKMVSARARNMGRHGFPNEWEAIGAVKNKVGHWYGNDETEAISCRRLDSCVTEFEAQGLELDASLMCWGPDFLPRGGTWDISRMVQYGAKNRRMIRDPLRLRTNAYRVLLTRARDACVILVPRIEEDGSDLLLPVYRHLREAGIRDL